MGHSDHPSEDPARWMGDPCPVRPWPAGGPDAAWCRPPLAAEGIQPRGAADLDGERSGATGGTAWPMRP
jgi:hypothetical protein